MSDVIKIILRILAALFIFLAGVTLGAWSTRKKTKKQTKDAIKDLQEEHKAAIEANKKEGEELQKKKDEIINRLKGIIERLKAMLSSVDSKGRPIAESVAGKRLQHTLLLQADNLKKL